MTAPQHPPIELVADLDEGLLPAEQAAAVTAHLASCPQCVASRESLHGVSSVLAAEGAAPWAMPPEVVGRLDSALQRANAERAAGVTPIGAARQPPSPGPATAPTPEAASPSRRRPLMMLAAAAAVVVIAGAAIGGWQGLRGGGGSSAPNAGGAPAVQHSTTHGDGSSSSDEAPPGNHEAPNQQGPAARAPAVSRATLAGLATQLTDADTAPTPLDGRCARPGDLGSADIVSLVTWSHHPAVLVVDPSARQAIVVGCHDGSHHLYSTGF